MSEPSNENTADEPMLAAFGRRVQQLRLLKEVKPADLARAAGISQQYLWRLEDGQQNASLRTLSRLALALKVPMSAFLEGIDPDEAMLEKRPYVRKPKEKAARDGINQGPAGEASGKAAGKRSPSTKAPKPTKRTGPPEA